MIRDRHGDQIERFDRRRKQRQRGWNGGRS